MSNQSGSVKINPVWSAGCGGLCRMCNVRPIGWVRGRGWVWGVALISI